ncbi:hypothetical protein JW721_00780 [Candidatus Micrarchaeota archaeon]|nr:hypothetical protein [Candidatus Micrarchaeota archaeon]
MRRHYVFALVLGIFLLAGCCGPIGPGEVKLTVSCDDFDIISPSYEFYKSMNDVPSFSCSVRNDGSGSVTVLVTSEVSGHTTSPFEQTLVLSPGSTKTVDIHYSFADSFYDLNDATSALMKTKFIVDGEIVRSDSANVQIEKSSVFSPDLGDEALIAMWVTYNDPCVEEIISEAKKFAPGGQFLGYLGDEYSMYSELEAVFYSLYFQDIKYVSSTFSTTSVDSAFYSQDIRFPYRSLKYKQMNCIDGAVLYSAILEKLDYETGIALIPGHAFVVVWDPFYEEWVPIETTVTGDDVSSFEDAVYYGYDAMADPYLEIVDVHAAITSGITPMPVGTHECNVDNLDEEAELYQELIGGISGQDCWDVDYGYLADGQCSWDEAAVCHDGVVYWDNTGECEGTSRSSYGNCYDTEYGDILNGYCTTDGLYVCVDGEIYIADAYPCPNIAGDLSCEDVDYGHMENGECSPDDAAICIDGIVYWAEAGDC